jgi:hypothetical protein
VEIEQPRTEAADTILRLKRGALPYQTGLVKAGYALIAAMVILVSALWSIGPTVFWEAPQGNRSSSDHAVAFYRWMTLITVVLVWISILLAHLIYLRKSNPSHSRAKDKPESESWLLPVFGYSVLILASLFFLIVSHGNTYLSLMTNDTFVYLDGIHRLNMGQLPHKDFHTALGSAAYFIPYLGYQIRGGMAGSLELASFLVAAVLTLFSVVLLRGRTSVFFAVLTIAFLALLVAMPMNAGTSGNDITHAMFYNRWGWVALTLVLITYIPPPHYVNGRLALEALLVASLIVFLFFLKVTYFIVALSFLFVLLWQPHGRRLAAYASLISLVFWALIEWQFSITGAYIEDLRMAMAASGAIRKGIGGSIFENFKDFLLVIVLLSILAPKIKLKWHALLYIAFVSAAGLLILNQNFQFLSIVIILAVLLWGYSLTSSNKKNGTGEFEPGSSNAVDRRIIGVLLIVFIAPALASDFRGMITLTKGLAKGEQLGRVTGLEGVYIDEKFSGLDKVHADADPITVFNEARAARKKQELSQAEYIETVNAGVRLLAAQNIQSGKIVTFDLANPFNFLTRGEPSRGDYSWFHNQRSISKTSYEPAPSLFRDVRFIMLPVIPITYETSQVLWELYGEYVESEYVPRARSKYWTLYERAR